MGIVSKLFGWGAERRSSDELSRKTDGVLSGNIENDALRPVFISEETALTLSAVWAAVRVVSQSIGILPVHLFERSEGKRLKVYDHPAFKVIETPNSYSEFQDLVQVLVVSVLLWGNGYIRVRRNNKFQPIELEFLPPNTVTPILSSERKLYYKLSSTGETLMPYDVIHVKNLSTDGYQGKSVIRKHCESLGLSRSAQTYAKNFFDKGANVGSVFTHPSEMKDEAYARLKEDLYRRTVGLQNSHAPFLLEGGLKYERMGIPPEDAQLLDTRKFSVTEIARIFGVPPHKIADLERSTNNNIEHQAMEFVTDTLQPIATAIEKQFRRVLLRDDEFSKYYFKFNFGALLRGDSKTRAEYYAIMTDRGLMSINEARTLEELNPVDGGEKHFVQLNMQTLDNAIKQQQENE